MECSWKRTDIARSLGKNFLDKQIDTFNKEHVIRKDSGVTLTNNKIKDIIKVIKSLEKTGILVKGSTSKITSQKGGFLDFLKALITAGLLLIKNILTPLTMF